MWSLDERRLVATVRDAHDGSVGGMEFIQSQPLMATSSVDNSIKVITADTNHYTHIPDQCMLRSIYVTNTYYCITLQWCSQGQGWWGTGLPKV